MKISGHTKVVGILGYPIAHTFSPRMHNAAFAHMGLDYVYLPFEVRPSELKRAVNGLNSLNIIGVNVTIPHKERVLDYLDELTKKARLLGAVNTIKLERGRLVGYNTDGEGFITSLKLETNTEPAGKSVLLLGAGGVAKSVAISLAHQEAKHIVVANRTLARAEALAYRLREIAPQTEASYLPLGSSELDKWASEAQIIINATSVGLKPNDIFPINPKLFHSGQLVYDLVYNPPKTRLLAKAEAQGAKTLNGLAMLVYQGALAFEIWTGHKAPVEVMRQAIITN